MPMQRMLDILKLSLLTTIIPFQRAQGATSQLVVGRNGDHR
jgi:hypothetical protein